MNKRLLSMVLVVAAFPAPAGASTWAERVASAREYAESRAGVESFALVDEQSRMHGYRMWKAVPSASVLKATLLLAYLRGERRLALAILTQFNPSHAYGTQTIRGIAARLLRESPPG